MKLLSLKVNQFRKFVVPTGLLDLQAGLNVLVGPNELGKSTLVRALHAGIFENHDARSEPIRELQNARSQAAPVVEICFELAGGVYTIRKRFLSKPYARLVLPDGVVLEGEKAESTLRQLLAFEKPGTRGSKPENYGIWNLLWLSQGDALAALDASSLAQSTLRSALEATVGDVLGGVQSQQLPQVICQARDALLTAAARPRGAYKAAMESVAEVSATLETLRSRRAELDNNLAELDSVTRSLEKHRAENTQAELQRSLAGARDRLREITQLAARISAADSELALRKDRLHSSRQALAQREALVTSAAQARTHFETLNAGLDAANAEEARLQVALGELRAKLAKARTDKENADAQQHSAEQNFKAASQAQQLEALRARLAEAEKWAVAVRDAERALAANEVTQPRLQAIDEAELALIAARSRLSAVATRVSFVLQENAVAAVTVDGLPLSGAEQEFNALEAMTIAIADVGEVNITPQISDVEALQIACDAATVTLQAALAAVACDSADQARAQFRARAAFERALSEARPQLESLAPAASGGTAALHEESEAMAGDLAALPEKPALDTLPSLDACRLALATASEAVRSASEAVEALRAQLDDVAKTLADHRDSWQGKRSALAVARQDDIRLQGELAGSEDPALLRQAAETALAAADEQEVVIARLQETGGGDSLASIEARIQRLEEAISAQHVRVSNLQQAQARLEGAIQSTEGLGIDETLAQAERDFELAQEEAAHQEREARVLDLLHQTLSGAEKQAHERFMAPIVAKVRPYLNVLFPGARIDLDEALGVAAMTRNASDTESFHRLSMGTREQLSVLTRIAFAEVMAEQGRPAMVVLDDVFAYSDDERMNRLFDVLTMASQRVQILLLTCRESLFAGVGGHPLALREISDDNLQSA